MRVMLGCIRSAVRIGEFPWVPKILRGMISVRSVKRPTCAQGTRHGAYVEPRKDDDDQ